MFAHKLPDEKKKPFCEKCQVIHKLDNLCLKGGAMMMIHTVHKKTQHVFATAKYRNS